MTRSTLQFHLARSLHGTLLETHFCEKGWIFSPSTKTCVKRFLSPNKTWSEAREACQNYNSDLMRVENETMQMFVKEHYLGVTPVWIGLRSTYNSNPFKWLDDSRKTNYASWQYIMSGEIYWGSLCVAINFERYWVIGHCDFSLGYVCEKSMRNQNFLCDNGWDFYPPEAKCFKEFSDPKTDWQGAREICQSYGGDLIVIQDTTKQGFYIDFISRRDMLLWIGLYWNASASEFRIQGNKPAFYSNFNAIDIHSEEDDACVATHGIYTRWYFEKCSKKSGFVCEQVSQARDDYVCPHGWLFYNVGRTCVKLFRTPKMKWEKARIYCQQEGGDLLRIEDKGKQRFVVDNYLAREMHWIGLNRPPNSTGFRWLDDPIVAEYFVWANENYYYDKEGDHICIPIFGSPGGEWYPGLQCWHTLSFICEKPVKYDLNPLSG